MGKHGEPWDAGQLHERLGQLGTYTNIEVCNWFSVPKMDTA